MPLTAQVDSRDASRIVFSEPVTLQQATAYLWARPPSSPNALRPDPAEKASEGRQRTYLIDKNDVGVVFSLQHGLDKVYKKMGVPLGTSRPAELPRWVPQHAQEAFRAGRLTDGVNRFAGTPPWGDVILWIRRSGGLQEVQVYQYYPESIEFYRQVTGGREDESRLLRTVYEQFNRDLAHLVEEKGLAPDQARAFIRNTNDEVFKLVLQAAADVMSTAGDLQSKLNAVRSSSGRILDAARKSGRPVSGIARSELQLRRLSASPLPRPPYHVTVPIDPELLEQACRLRAGKAGISRTAFHEINVAVARVRVKGEKAPRYIGKCNVPGKDLDNDWGFHSEWLILEEVRKLRRQHGTANVVLEQLYSERIPCHHCRKHLDISASETSIFFTIPASSEKKGPSRGDLLMRRYGLEP